MKKRKRQKDTKKVLEERRAAEAATAKAPSNLIVPVAVKEKKRDPKLLDGENVSTEKAQKPRAKKRKLQDSTLDATTSYKKAQRNSSDISGVLDDEVESIKKKKRKSTKLEKNVDKRPSDSGERRQAIEQETGKPRKKPRISS
jgi:hypothetical protein